MSSARQTRTVPRILRSASFRLTLIYAALFVVSACVLFATVFVTATRAMASADRPERAAACAMLRLASPPLLPGRRRKKRKP